MSFSILSYYLIFDKVLILILKKRTNLKDFLPEKYRGIQLILYFKIRNGNIFFFLILTKLHI